MAPILSSLVRSWLPGSRPQIGGYWWSYPLEIQPNMFAQHKNTLWSTARTPWTRQCHWSRPELDVKLLFNERLSHFWRPPCNNSVVIAEIKSTVRSLCGKGLLLYELREAWKQFFYHPLGQDSQVHTRCGLELYWFLPNSYPGFSAQHLNRNFFYPRA